MNERSRAAEFAAMQAADERKRADLDWLKGAPGRRLVNGQRLEAESGLADRPERGAPPEPRQPDRRAPVERLQNPQIGRETAQAAAAERARSRKLEDARSVIEQIGGQLAGVEARIRGAQATGDAHAAEQWKALRQSLEREMAKRRADMEDLRRAA